MTLVSFPIKFAVQSAHAAMAGMGISKMKKKDFIDYYEVLEVSPKATSETIERVFRYLAHRYHPDTSNTNDKEKFNRLVEANQVLKDPVARAEFDIEFAKYQSGKKELLNDASNSGDDTDERHQMLSLFYAKRKRSMKEPGMGLLAVEQILGCPEEVIEFYLWYFREKGWIKREESGLLAITAEGVDEIESRNRRWASDDRLIRDGRFDSGPQYKSVEMATN